MLNWKPLSRSRSLLVFLELLAICLLAHRTAEGIVINDDKGRRGSRVLGAFINPAIGELSVGCTGTLISPNEFLTAKHCTEFRSPGSMTVNFGANSNSPDFSVNVVAKEEAGGGPSSLLDGTDVTLLTLGSNVPASVAEPLPIAASTASGMTALTSGYGFNGVGSVGHQFSADGRRWTGANIVDAYGPAYNTSGAIGGTTNIFNTDFDDGSAGANELDFLGSTSNPIPWEATTAPGDSGGPLLAVVDGELSVIAVLSGGTTNTSVYGDISWWTGLDPFIDGNGDLDLSGGVAANRSMPSFAEFRRDTAAASVPEPASHGLLLAAAIGLFASLRKRRI